MENNSDQMKKCSRCKITKPINCFYVSNKPEIKIKRKSRCIRCQKETSKPKTYSYIIEKRCKRCGKLKASNNFYPSDYMKNRLSSNCKSCSQIEKYSNRTSQREYMIKMRYGITQKEYDGILLKQNGVCAICERTNKLPKPLYIDHNHTTGKIRGLLCATCNSGIGSFEDNILLLSKAITYLEANNEVF